MAPFSGFSKCLNGRQKDLQGSLGVSLTHYSKLGLRTLVVFLACYPMTISLLQDITVTDWEFLDSSLELTWDIELLCFPLQIASKKLNDREFVEDWLVRWKEATVAEVGFQSCSLHLFCRGIFGLRSQQGPRPIPSPTSISRIVSVKWLELLQKWNTLWELQALLPSRRKPW